MKISGREIAREIKFPDRESREIGKYLCTCSEIVFFPTPGTRYLHLNNFLAGIEAGANIKDEQWKKIQSCKLGKPLFSETLENCKKSLIKQHKKCISRFPDRDLKFPDSGKISSGPEKSGIGKPELAIPSSSYS